MEYFVKSKSPPKPHAYFGSPPPDGARGFVDIHRAGSKHVSIAARERTPSG